MGADRFYPNGGVYRLDPGEVPGLGFYREADHDRIVAAAEARGWNAALEAVQARVMNLPVVGRLAGTDSTLAAAQVLQAIAALRKPEVEG